MNHSETDLKACLKQGSKRSLRALFKPPQKKNKSTRHTAAILWQGLLTGALSLALMIVMAVVVNVVISDFFSSSLLAAEKTSEALTAQQQQAIESGKEAFQSQWNMNWYDAKQDGIRPINIKVRKTRSRRSNSDWLRFLGNFTWEEFFRFIAWMTLFSLLFCLVYYAMKKYLNREVSKSLKESEDIRENRISQLERVESLPIEVKKPLANHLDEARRHYESGEYAEAIIYLFSYQLLELDKAHFLHLSKGKTNRQYLREVYRTEEGKQNQKLQSKFGELLCRTVEIFEASFFGNHPPSAAQFESCWQPMNDFSGWIQETTKGGK